MLQYILINNGSYQVIALPTKAEPNITPLSQSHVPVSCASRHKDSLGESEPHHNAKDAMTINHLFCRTEST